MKPLSPLLGRSDMHSQSVSGRSVQCRLKYWIALSCFWAAPRVRNVPRFFRFPVFESFFRKYNRYSPDLSFLIITIHFHFIWPVSAGARFGGHFYRLRERGERARDGLGPRHP